MWRIIEILEQKHHFMPSSLAKILLQLRQFATTRRGNLMIMNTTLQDVKCEMQPECRQHTPPDEPYEKKGRRDEINTANATNE